MKNLNQVLNYLISGAVLVLAIGYYFFNNQNRTVIDTRSTSERKVDQSKVDQVVNKYMQQVGDRAKLTEIRAQRELEELQKKLELQKKKELLMAEKNLQEIPLEKQIFKAQENQSPVESEFSTSESALNGDLSGANEAPILDVKNMTPEQKSEYARQYKQNAKRGGYLIELNEDLEVIKSTPIRKPTQQNDQIDTLPTD